MAKKASAKASGTEGKKIQKRSTPAGDGGSSGQRAGAGTGEGAQNDVVDALLKLLQSPIVIDLLAVGATAALAAITEHRSSRTQGAVHNPKKTLKAAGKAAAAAVGRRIATEIDEIKAASKKAEKDRKSTAGAEA
jgi:hypothetical protein